MTSAERREARRVLARHMAGDRAAVATYLRSLAADPRRDPFDGSGQLVMAFLSFHCTTLDCPVPGHVCVTRQKVTDIQRTRQGSRGQGTDHPSCDTRKCAQGRKVRQALDPDAPVTWTGAGPGGRFARPGRKAEG